MKKLLGVLFVAVVAGCGSSEGGVSPTATAHSLAVSEPETIPADEMLTLGPFTLPAEGTVEYTILDTPTGVGSDKMDVAVATDASAQTANPVVYGVKQGVSSTSSTTPPLPVGTYDLLVQCANLVDDCIFEVTLTATY